MTGHPRCTCPQCAGQVSFLHIWDYLDHMYGDGLPTSGETPEDTSRAGHPSTRAHVDTDPTPPHGLDRPRVPR